MSPEEIKRRRLNIGKTQEDVAREIGVSTPTFRNWEYGLNPPKSSNELKLNKYFEKYEKELLD